MTSLLDVITTDGGFTFDPGTGDLLRVGECTGFMIAIAGTEMRLGPAELTRDQLAARFAALVSGAPAGVYVGGWLSPERGFMIELSELHVCDRASAIAMGMGRGQECILDLATGEFIPTGGNGDGGATGAG